MSEYEDFKELNNRTLARYGRRWQKAKQKKKALEHNAQEFLKAAIKDDLTRRNFKRQAGLSVQRNDSGQLGTTEQAMVRASKSGADVVGGIDEGVITGFDPLPWQSDGDEWGDDF